MDYLPLLRHDLIPYFLRGPTVQILLTILVLHYQILVGELVVLGLQLYLDAARQDEITLTLSQNQFLSISKFPGLFAHEPASIDTKLDLEKLERHLRNLLSQ